MKAQLNSFNAWPDGPVGTGADVAADACDTADSMAENLTRSELRNLLGDPLAVTIDDPDHSRDERRFLTTGLSSRSGLIIVTTRTGLTS